jgi:hypothetical protein
MDIHELDTIDAEAYGLIAAEFSRIESASLKKGRSRDAGNFRHQN